MNRVPLIICGVLLAFLTSWVGLVLTSYSQLGHYLPEIDENTGDQSPPAFSGTAEQGRAVYAANGCAYCHTQTIRPGADLARDWGERRTVARDWMRDAAAYPGQQRTGPDLTNVGSRKSPDSYRYTEAWHYQHLYQPQIVSPGSIMPPMRFLFDKRKVVGQRSIDAIKVEGAEGQALKPDEEVVPTEQARQLVTYLLSLKRSGYPLPEAPPELPEEQ